MTTYISCRRCVPAKTPLFIRKPLSNFEPEECAFQSDKLPPGTWIFRGTLYYCPHLTTAARKVSRPWYSDVAATMNARQGRKDIK